MKTHLIVLIGTLLLGVSSQGEAKNAKKRISLPPLRAVSDAWCPYSCEADSNKPGYLIEILKAVMKPHDIPVKYTETNWARALNAVQKGTEYEALIGAVKEGAPQLVYPAVPLGYSQNCFYTLKDRSWKFHGIDSLEAIHLGVIGGYAYSSQIAEYLKKNKKNAHRITPHFGEKGVLTRVFQSLIAGRVDALIEDRAVVNYTLHKAPILEQVTEAGCEMPSPVFVAFSPNHPHAQEYADLLTEGVLKLIKTGEMKAILKRYYLKPWY